MIVRPMKALTTLIYYKMTMNFTPEMIERLQPNEVFVFGSNINGQHCSGAARSAYEYFGAVWGKGVGIQGCSYAIPTMQGDINLLRLYVDDFIDYASTHPDLIFLVTRVGCGIAGYKDNQIAPLFVDALNLKNVTLPYTFVRCLLGPTMIDTF